MASGIDENTVGSSKGKERILFVDDEELFVSMGSRMLESHGYQVTSMTDSDEALQSFIYQPGKFDLVITSHSIPGMTGKEFAQKLLDVRSDIPIILCSASSHISQEKINEWGIREFVKKPVDSNMLSKTVRKTLDKKY